MKLFALVFLLATSLGASGRVPSVPFNATIATEVTPLGPCGPTCLTLDIAGSGQASHMGRTTVVGPSEIDFATGEQSGTSTLMAADGSTLDISFSGSFVPGPGPGDATFEGSWTVISGTGRFADADGGGSYWGTASGPAGELNLAGQISKAGQS